MNARSRKSVTPHEFMHTIEEKSDKGWNQGDGVSLKMSCRQ